MSEFDLYLFSEGTLYRAYEKLGSHPKTINEKSGVSFAVWAPNANSVSVVGDFNHWDGRKNQMNPVGSSGIWEIFVPDLTEKTLYKYEIKTRNNTLLLKTDPYAFYSEVRPKTASIVWNINRYVWQDDDWMKKRKERQHLAAPLNIYEIHLGSWMRGEGNTLLSYRDLAPKLAEYVLRMGFSHVEFMPFTEHPLDESWGYQTTGYFAPTSRFGTPDDFAYLVDHLHQNGIGVIADWVPAHFPKDGHSLARFDGTALYEHTDPRQAEHKDWGTLIFNYGRYEVANFLINSALFWLDKYHIDGLRVDAVASMLYLDYSKKPGEWIPNRFGGNENLEAVAFLKRLNQVVYGYHPDVFTAAEESTSWPMVSRPTYAGGLGFGYKWNMGWMHDSLHYISRDAVYRKFHQQNLTFALLYAFSENFILPLSHDEVVHGKASLLARMPGDDWQKFATLRLLLGYMYTHPGKKLLFMGAEIGQWREWDFLSSIDWHLLQYEPHRKLQRFVRDLNLFYRNQPPLYQLDSSPAGFEWIDFNDTEGSIVSYQRYGQDKNDSLVVICNFTPVPRFNYCVGVRQPGFYRELLNSDSEYYGGGNLGNSGGLETQKIPCHNRPFSLSLTIPPLAALILKHI
ncbi:MAG: 1,4-alpha-glucan branching protein GlgB [Candidatus Ratteibacteria bacterium]|jgi:1,4-alpha-glucan branching enzyme